MLNDLNERYAEFEASKQTLNESQLAYIKSKYNQLMKFEYAEGHLCYMFKAKESHYNLMLYYLSFEYEEKEIEAIAKINGEVFVVYNNCDRVENFIQGLEKVKN